jgi:ornithine cyclodeaminase/alanine dehydrogenase
MTPEGILLLTREEVASLLTIDDCIAAVEDAFRQHGQGKAMSPKVLGMPSRDGGFHIKAAMLGASPAYFATKINGNFPSNAQRFGLPTIQGLIVLCDAVNGSPLAVMDSIEITTLRTGAATAVAARYLARPEAKVATICGCGNQGRVQLRALCRILSLDHVYAFDLNAAQAQQFAGDLACELPGVAIEGVENLPDAVGKSEVCVTCTPAKRYFIRKDYVAPGTFLAAVGADNEDKQELDPQLLVGNKVVADILDQCAAIGDLHHAIAAGLVNPGNVHAELGEVVAGKKPGRTSTEEITIFDSTGTALQDVAAAILVYERAASQGRGRRLRS